MNAKRFLISLTLTFLCLCTALAYTVEEIPNVHLADKRQYVSNPDGILTQQTVGLLNASIAEIWKSTSAEVVAVVVDDIGNSDVDSFATDLFRHWGIGKADNNNGVLILVARGQRKATIRTGYGTEGLLPDIVCGRIIRDDMAPFFKIGDYDKGMIAAVEKIRRIMTTPGAAAELKSKYENDRKRQEGNFFRNYLIFAGMATVVLLFIVVYTFIKSSGKDSYERYSSLTALGPLYMGAALLTLGMGIVPLLLLLLLKSHCRNKRRRCPRCNKKMKKMSEAEDNRYLTEAQDLEERLQSVDYDVWVCGNCGMVETLSFVNKATVYSQCDLCKAHTMMQTSSRIVTQPTATKEGLQETTFVCRNCGNTKVERKKIAPSPDGSALAAGVLAAGLFGGGRGGGGFGGGSFGGGSTGGGGASGGW